MTNQPGVYVPLSALFLVLLGSVVPIVASYRKLVAVTKNRRQSIETFHYRLSELRYGSKSFRNIWFICGWLGSSKRSNSILHLFSTYFKFNSYKIEAKKRIELSPFCSEMRAVRYYSILFYS